VGREHRKGEQTSNGRVERDRDRERGTGRGEMSEKKVEEREKDRSGRWRGEREEGERQRERGVEEKGVHKGGGWGTSEERERREKKGEGEGEGKEEEKRRGQNTEQRGRNERGETWRGFDRCDIFALRTSLSLFWERGTHSILPHPTTHPFHEGGGRGSGAKPMLKEACPWAV
jgi:hypothetical protein